MKLLALQETVPIAYYGPYLHVMPTVEALQELLNSVCKSAKNLRYYCIPRVLTGLFQKFSVTSPQLTEDMQSSIFFELKKVWNFTYLSMQKKSFQQKTCGNSVSSIGFESKKLSVNSSIFQKRG